ncbi:MAG TPA: prepilin-type N-terminal cleavage/methylation domain-containing protein [Gemmatimonadaceae bacterium]|jgi:Tfp pilus assembly protein PilV|nr:prepilin-type N-terminal cleavage/methylation domain-containing protein [Gemmatimonadaceae bacterium]
MRPTTPRPRAGFTLIEVVVAVILADVALLGLAAGTAVLVRRQAELHARSAATAIAGNRLQTLIAAGCGGSAAPSGRATTSIFTERWSLGALDGAIATRELSDSVSYAAYGADHVLVLHTRFPC